MGKISKKYNIILAHSKVDFNINNESDVSNLDYILKNLLENKNSTDNTLEIFETTSLKYLQRLEEDGLISLSNSLEEREGHYIQLISSESHLIDKGEKFIKDGGYKKILSEFNKSKKTFFEKLSNINIVFTIIGYLFTFLIFIYIILSLIFKCNFKIECLLQSIDKIIKNSF